MSQATQIEERMRTVFNRLSIRHVGYWFGLSGLVGLVGGGGALAFKWLIDLLMSVFWVRLIGYTPPTPHGEPLPFPAVPGPPLAWALVLVPALGGLASAFLVYRFAPEAEGHGTDAAINAYHRERGRMHWRTPIIKVLASAFTLASGGSAGREGPIAQIGAGFGSMLAQWLHLPTRERRILLAAGMAAGIGAIFRAPLAGALFAAEVLYSEPDIESEVLVPSLLSSIVAYSLYCSVHGFGHLLTGTQAFAFHTPLALVAYVGVGLVVALGGIAFVTLFNTLHAAFKRPPLTRYLRPVLGGALTGLMGLMLWKATGQLPALAVMGSGYGILQQAVTAAGGAGPSLTLLAVVAVGKMLTTSFTIGSGGSGGVFGPSMVIGGCLGAMVGTLLHGLWPQVVPAVGPFTIVGMAGFFAGVANTPLSTVLMVADITGNYALLIPSMLAVGIAFIVARHWTLYPAQVRTRAESPAHRSEFLYDVLSGVSVRQVFDASRNVVTVRPDTPMHEIRDIFVHSTQLHYPVVTAEGRLVGIFSLNDVRGSLYAPGIDQLVVAQDVANTPVFTVTLDDSLNRALEVFTRHDFAEIPVVAEQDARLLGMLTRRDLIAAYNQRLGELLREGQSVPAEEQVPGAPLA